METGVEEMRAQEKAVEWLRPLVEQHGWDYCVVWKLNDDPSRFVEFLDCCCAGGFASQNAEAEKSVDQIGVRPDCRDVHMQHRIHTRACETLARIPATMSLYSGIHTDVAMENEIKWLSEDDGTLVLIPLGGGLIELFAAKRVDRDQTILDFIQYQYNVSLEHDAVQNYLNLSVDEVPKENELGQCLQNSSPGVLFTETTPGQQLQVKGLQARSCFPGSSTGSNPSNSASGHVSLPPSLNNSPCSKRTTVSKRGKFSNPQAEVASAKVNAATGLGNSKLAHKTGKEGSKAKNLEVERKRRSRIKEGEFQLRALVPNISKMDRVSIISDAIDHIIQQKRKIQDLEEELKQNDHGENVDHGGQISCKLKTKIKFKNSEVKVEVREICERSLSLRIEAEQQVSAFARMMEAVCSKGLQVEDFNITSCDGLIIGGFQVEADRKVPLDKLKESLIKELGAAAATVQLVN